MKEFRGTPGEWRTFEDGNGRWHVIGPGTDTLADLYHPGRNPGSMEANVRVMAASKDLLEALRACIDYGSMTGDEWVVEKAHAAIAKALGL